MLTVRGEPSRRVLGLIDVESERVGAFSDADRALLECCARLLLPLWEPQNRALR